jgi:hypothetical protein
VQCSFLFLKNSNLAHVHSEISSSVDEWLASLQLKTYTNVFKENGYDMLNAFVGLDDSTLLMLGIDKIGHCGILVREAVKLAKHFM